MSLDFSPPFPGWASRNGWSEDQPRSTFAPQGFIEIVTSHMCIGRLPVTWYKLECLKKINRNIASMDCYSRNSLLCAVPAIAYLKLLQYGLSRTLRTAGAFVLPPVLQTVCCEGFWDLQPMTLTSSGNQSWLFLPSQDSQKLANSWRTHHWRPLPHYSYSLHGESLCHSRNRRCILKESCIRSQAFFLPGPPVASANSSAIVVPICTQSIHVTVWAL